MIFYWKTHIHRICAIYFSNFCFYTIICLLYTSLWSQPYIFIAIKLLACLISSKTHYHWIFFLFYRTLVVESRDIQTQYPNHNDHLLFLITELRTLIKLFYLYEISGHIIIFPCYRYVCKKLLDLLRHLKNNFLVAVLRLKKYFCKYLYIFHYSQMFTIKFFMVFYHVSRANLKLKRANIFFICIYVYSNYHY